MGLAPPAGSPYQACPGDRSGGNTMNGDHGRATGEERRRERLSASLRDNLKRRKTQMRGRAALAQKPAESGEPDSPPEPGAKR